ncbi:hypothetical protein Bbelb_081610 [Branchiostoma belcheri]|nr:hypothetical protein Bbelb_081610 [Branchiostoma belcheri]
MAGGAKSAEKGLHEQPPWRLLVQPSALQSFSMEVARTALRDTPAELCATTILRYERGGINSVPPGTERASSGLASFTASGGTTSAFGRDTLGGGHQQAGR